MFKPVFFAVLSVLTAYLYNRLRFLRLKQYCNFPQPPSHLILGHLKILDSFIRGGKLDRHSDAVFEELNESIGSPPLMLLDLRPVNTPFVIISDQYIAEQVTRASTTYPYSLPKASSLKYVEPLIGSTSILSAAGHDWKALRRKFNPGFSPQHLMTLLPKIVDCTSVFIKNLDSLVASREEFPLATYIVNLTFDIIGSTVMDEALDSQALDPSQQGELIQLFKQLLGTYMGEQGSPPWWLIPRKAFKRRKLGDQIDAIIQDVIRRKHMEQLRSTEKTRSRSILSLSLQDIDKLTPEFLLTTSHQIKTFLLAGHDTTSNTLAWTFYELSRTPRVLSCIRKELDDLLGPDSQPDSVRDKLLSKEGPELVRRMVYVSAVVKETLRVHPPAGTAREALPGKGFTVQTRTGDNYCLDNTSVYILQSLIHHDKAVYGQNADEFYPERWLKNVGDPANNQAEEAGDNAKSDVPPGSFRPFERGPRNCIGQEFANIESHVIIAMVARHYEFTKIGLGELMRDSNCRPIMEKNGQYAVKSELYNTRAVTGKPVDEMRMVVSLASSMQN